MKKKLCMHGLNGTYLPVINQDLKISILIFSHINFYERLKGIISYHRLKSLNCFIPCV